MGMSMYVYRIRKRFLYSLGITEEQIKEFGGVLNSQEDVDGIPYEITSDAEREELEEFRKEGYLLNKLETISTDNRAVTKSGGNTNTLNSGAQHSESRENDTPQNGGNFNDDEHTSSISISDYNAYKNEYTFVYNDEKSQHSGTVTTSIDPSTIMERLTEIREKYVNLYSEWCNEFRVFIYNPATFENRNECGCIYYEED